MEKYELLITRAVLFSCLLLCSVIIFFTSFFCRITPYEIKSDNFIVKNWSSSPLLKIEFVGRDSACPKDYSPLQLGSTPEVMPGWDCTKPNQTYFQEGIEDFKYLSHLDQLDKSCKYISGIEAIEMNVWRGVKICALTSGDNYLSIKKVPGIFSEVFNTTTNLTQLVDKSNCTDGFKSCGIVDTFSNVLCVKTSSPCPINYMVISNSNQTNDNSTFKLDFPKTSVGNYTLNKSLLYSSRYDPNNVDKSRTVITGLTISEGEICANPRDRSFPKDFSYFLYENYDFYNMCETRSGDLRFSTNPHYKYLDQDYGKNIYSAYEMYFYEVLPLFPAYVLDGNPRYNLYYSSYFGINTNSTLCHFPFTNQDVQAFLETESLGQIKYLYIGVLVSSALVIATVFISFPISYLKYETIEEEKEFNSCRYILIMIYFIFVIILFILSSVFFSLTFNRLSSWQTFKALTKDDQFEKSYSTSSNIYNCTDQYTANILISLAQITSEFYYNTYIVLFISGLLAIFPFLVYVLYRFFKILKFPSL